MSFEVGTKVATEKASITTLPHSLGQQDNLALYLAIPFFKKKWANPGLFFVYFRLFKQTLQFLQQINVKMSIQYPAPGFELTTF